MTLPIRWLRRRGVTRVSVFAAILTGAIGGAGCGGDDPGPAGDDVGDDTDDRTCAELTEEWEAIIDGLPTACTTAGGCTYFGGAPWVYCEGLPRISHRWATVATATVPQAVRDQLQALEVAYTARCTDCGQAGVLCTWDGEYAVGAECYEGRCIPELEACGPVPYDAAIDAEPMSDASLADASP